MAKIQKQLNDLRNSIKVTKDQKGYKGKYMYRSLENIYTEIKKHSESVTVVVDTDLLPCGENLVIKATATAVNEDDEKISVNGFCEVGNCTMSREQSFGSAQTYAIRYALQNLLLLDDNIDVDSTTYQESKQESKEAINNFKSLKEVKQEREKLSKRYSVPQSRVDKYCLQKFRKLEIDLTESEYNFVAKVIEKAVNEF